MCAEAHLQESEGFVDVSADGRVVDGSVLDDAIGVDDEEAAQRHALLVLDVVLLDDLVLEVRHQGVLEVPCIHASGSSTDRESPIIQDNFLGLN